MTDKKYRILKIAIVGLAILPIIAYVFIFFYSPAIIIDFYRDNSEKAIVVGIKPFGIEKEIFRAQYYVAQDLSWAPNKKIFAFFDNIKESKDMSLDREWALKVINPRVFSIKTIFIGDYHTSYFSWLDNKTVRVYVNGGVGTSIYRDISTDIKTPFVAAEHMSPEFWTPEKTF